jgi:Family of unknown function (DUF6317)
MDGGQRAGREPHDERGRDMTAGYHVILEDLSTMASKFSAESTTVKGLEKDLDDKSTTTGDSELDTMLSTALTTLLSLNKGIADNLKKHSGTLLDCKADYHSTDSDHARLLDSMMDAAEKDAEEKPK